MQIFKLEKKEAAWGDYGSILVSGMSAHLERQNGLLQLERTGPYVPPLINSGICDIIVTDSIKCKMIESGLKGISFKPVIKKRIVYLDWTSWDFEAEDPPFYPESGSPEDYILEAAHSESVSKRIGDLWEVVIPETGIFNGDCFIGNDPGADIFKASNRGFVLLSEAGKEWIERNASDWMKFEQISIGYQSEPYRDPESYRND